MRVAERSSDGFEPTLASPEAFVICSSSSAKVGVRESMSARARASCKVLSSYVYTRHSVLRNSSSKKFTLARFGGR